MEKKGGNMSDNTRWQQFNSIIDNEGLDIKEKGLLLILFRHVNYKTGYADPSRSLIKKKTGISDNRTLDKIFNSLINKGFLIRESGKGNRSRYFIKVGGEITPSVKNEPSGEVTPLLGGEITPIVGGEITPQKENKRKIKENIKKEKGTNLDKIINSYSDNEELINTICDFLKMRKAIKKPMTDRALKIMLYQS
ncbi:helix-turn-helix domain-containing protein [uncultured Clostridium sp.]|uniref:helix-turn-helix domain-containing protein n=1 Tax=uncultured Clostridium sp. TaxID=59620 RepID=UPI0025E211A4|nr:helix-turn-helix domain-containing protein [uncultured Clostridium sp.]